MISAESLINCYQQIVSWSIRWFALFVLTVNILITATIKWQIYTKQKDLWLSYLFQTQIVLKLWLDSQCISLQMGIYSINFIMFLRVVMRQCVHWLNRRVAPEIPSRNHTCLSKRFAGSGHDTVPKGHKQWPGSPNQISLRIFRAK